MSVQPIIKTAGPATGVSSGTLVRRPLARGNIYRFKGYAGNGIEITAVSFRGHPEDDGGLAGVGVKWLNRSGGSFWYPFATESDFWADYRFSNACDPEHA